MDEQEEGIADDLNDGQRMDGRTNSACVVRDNNCGGRVDERSKAAAAG